MDLKSEDSSSQSQTPEHSKPNQDTIDEIKRLLRLKLQRSGMNTLIRRMVRDICSDKNNINSLNPDEVIEEIYRRGATNAALRSIKRGDQTDMTPLDVDSEFSDEGKCKEKVHGDENDETEVNFAKLFSRLESIGLNGIDEHSEYSTDTTTETQTKNDISFRDDKNISCSGKRYLKMEILGGNAFLDHLLAEESLNYGNTRSKFVLHVFYKSQRFSTKPTICSCDPDLRDTFMIDLGYFDKTNAAELLTVKEPIRIILVRDDSTASFSSIVSHCLHDWRFLLMDEDSSKHFSLEMMGIGQEYQVPIGILNIRLSIIPRAHEKVSKATYTSQINAEETVKNQGHRSFLVYAKQWWKDFHQIRPGLKSRNVKLFSYDENMVSRPIQSFVKPIVADTILLTPHHAVWFVSLIPVTNFKCNETDTFSETSLHPKVTTGIATESEYWQSLESTIASKAGSIADHAILLCSLLLGFGLDAYVASGKKIGNVSWLWVVTFDRKGVPKFWESTKGVCQTLLPRMGAEHSESLGFDQSIFVVKNNGFNINTVSILFNNKSLYANIQPSDRVDMVDWNIKSPYKWKQISEASFKTIDTGPPSLLFQSRNMILISSDIEMHLKTLISQTRQNQNLKTIWDDKMRLIMGQRIANDEIVASSGANQSENYFENAILNYLPPGYDFKGYQCHSYTANSLKLFSKIIQDPKFKEIVFIRGDDVQLSVRVSCFPYPEDLTSVRIMIGCKFLCVD